MFRFRGCRVGMHGSCLVSQPAFPFFLGMGNNCLVTTAN